MRILLLKPFQPIAAPVMAPPLGLLYLVSILRERYGKEVHIDYLDMKAHKLPPAWLRSRMQEYNPDVVGVSALNCEAGASMEIAQIAKAYDPKTLTVLGGPWALHRSRELLGRTEFDWVVSGPGDRIFPEALERHFGGGDLGTDLPGLSYRNGHGVHVSTENDNPTDLDAIPFPAWDLVDFDLYARLPNQANMMKGRRYATLFTSRGCPYKCNYCHDLFTKRFAARSAENVLAEIELLYERYGVDEFEIVDDIFNLHKPRLKKIFSEVKRRWNGKLHFSFPNGVRGDILDGPTLDALREGGTYAICIAIETATPRLQDLVEKHLKIDRALEAIDMADERGMMVSGFFMLGFPTETPQEIRHTIDCALKSRLTLAHFFSVIPQPETPLYPLAMQEGREALLASDKEEEDGAQLRQSRSWYELAYGYPLGRVIRNAHLRFYFSPRRVLRILRRVPLKSLAASFVQFWKVLFIVRARAVEPQ
jgi:radical SAM superfamily enzyme YgiQ (UPF0313 family)